MVIPLIMYLVSPVQNASLKKNDPRSFFFLLVAPCLKHGENVARGVAFLELGSEWVCYEIIPRAFLICFEGIIEN